MKKLLLLSILSVIQFTSYGQITHNETVTINPSNYGPKLILDDANTANKVPIEFRSNNIVKWELGMRKASEGYDLGLWRYNGSYSYLMWFNHDDGNVGIGTNNPQSTLEVQSSGAAYSASPSFTVRDISNRGTIFLESETDNPTDFVFKNNNRLSWVMSTRSSTDGYALRIYPSINGTSWSSPILSMQTSGSVGIGTTTTGTHRLAVEGTIGAREIKVEAGTWSDFVFHKSYELRTLEEVEEHITEKGHLPEIPSEAEVTENGINLGEMNAKLLQKIEELTLYLIEQNKEIRELKELTKQQQSDIERLKSE